MTKVFILYWGGDSGNREDCSIFYTESKVFMTMGAAEADAAARKIDNDGLIADEDDDAIEDGFYTHIEESELVS